VKTTKSNDVKLRYQIKVIVHESGYICGKRRVHKELTFDDVSVGLNKVTNLMKDMGIYVR